MEAEAVRVEMRVLDAKTGASKSDSGLVKPSAAKAGGPVADAYRVPVETLAAGDYALEVSVVDAAGKPLKRTAEFAVIEGK